MPLGSMVEGWRSGVSHPPKAWSPLRPFFVAVRRLSSYAEAAMIRGEGQYDGERVVGQFE